MAYTEINQGGAGGVNIGKFPCLESWVRFKLDYQVDLKDQFS